MIKFKSIRSTVSRIFTESQQMKIVICISDIFWFLRKYFLAVDIDYSKEFINNWKKVKPESSLDRERNFTLYQLLNIHNNSFKNEETNIIEFGVSRGSSLITICNFVKKNSNIFGIDSFGIYAEEIKKLSTSNVDQNYQGSQIAFNKRIGIFLEPPGSLRDLPRHIPDHKTTLKTSETNYYSLLA